MPRRSTGSPGRWRSAACRIASARWSVFAGMGWASDVVATIARCGLDLVGHFTLPDEAWWDVRDAEVLAVLDRLESDTEMCREYSAYDAYECFVVRR